MSTLVGLKGNDLLVGSRGADSILGDGGFDNGGATAEPIVGDDLIFGGRGADVIFGGGGDDVLIGGRGPDTLSGGDGADTFVFFSKRDSRNDPFGHFDTIDDFSSTEGDQIDLSNLPVKGVRITDEGQLFVNVDNDRRAEVRIVVKTEAGLSEADLIL